jgi:hypothetical protein
LNEEFELSTVTTIASNPNYVVQFTGAASQEGVGGVVNYGGDVNNDTYQDILLGVGLSRSQDGGAYLVFGRALFSTSLDLSNLEADSIVVFQGEDGLRGRAGSAVRYDDFC